MGGATRRSRRPRVTQAVTGARFNGCSKKKISLIVNSFFIWENLRKWFSALS
uniref:Uncharacterized protein n=1 Tax=Anguilla anguilla TaxID=7936 RepID=A0A0E9TPW3_ANGAN